MLFSGFILFLWAIFFYFFVCFVTFYGNLHIQKQPLPPVFWDWLHKWEELYESTDSEDLSNFFWECLFWACACNFLIRVLPPVFLLQCMTSYFPSVCLWSCRLSGDVTHSFSFVLNGCWVYKVHYCSLQCSRLGETETSPSGSSL